MNIQNKTVLITGANRGMRNEPERRCCLHQPNV